MANDRRSVFLLCFNQKSSKYKINDDWRIRLSGCRFHLEKYCRIKRLSIWRKVFGWEKIAQQMKITDNTARKDCMTPSKKSTRYCAKPFSLTFSFISSRPKYTTYTHAQCPTKIRNRFYFHGQNIDSRKLSWRVSRLHICMQARISSERNLSFILSGRGFPDVAWLLRTSL